MQRFGRRHKLSFSLLQNLLLMLCDRFNDPLSKLGSYNLQKEYTGLGNETELPHIYRTLDYLAINNDTIQSHIFDEGGTAQGMEYIVGDRLKSMSEPAIVHLTKIKNYSTVIIKDDEGNDIPLQYCTYPYKSRTVICTYSGKTGKEG